MARRSPNCPFRSKGRVANSLSGLDLACPRDSPERQKREAIFPGSREVQVEQFCNPFIINGLKGAGLAFDLHLYQWPGTVPRSYASWQRRPGMGLDRIAQSFLRYVAFSALCFVLNPSAKAQTAVDLSGSYACTQAKVQGKVTACTAAPLILKNDGRFELRGWEGSYLVDGEWVTLTDSLTKARAKIIPGHKIVLRYYGKHGWAEMIYERRVVDLGKTSLS